MPFLRRRPLARAAVVGGAAYYAGKRGAQAQAATADQDARLEALEAQQYQQQVQAPPPPAPAAPSGVTDAGIEELKKLAELKDQGILTEAEFEVQKAKILQGG
jgi:putative oligomerization/nucleic acid binding protein